MRKFEIYANGDEYLDIIKIRCEHFEVVDERAVMADNVVISFRKDMYAITFEGMDIWKNKNI